VVRWQLSQPRLQMTTRSQQADELRDARSVARTEVCACRVRFGLRVATASQSFGKYIVKVAQMHETHMCNALLHSKHAASCSEDFGSWGCQGIEQPARGSNRRGSQLARART
jgi:hypothetical protein